VRRCRSRQRQRRRRRRRRRRSRGVKGGNPRLLTFVRLSPLL
jgi:hypothetical protein